MSTFIENTQMSSRTFVVLDENIDDIIYRNRFCINNVFPVMFSKVHCIQMTLNDSTYHWNPLRTSTNSSRLTLALTNWTSIDTNRHTLFCQIKQIYAKNGMTHIFKLFFVFKNIFVLFCSKIKIPEKKHSFHVIWRLIPKFYFFWSIIILLLLYTIYHSWSSLIPFFLFSHRNATLCLTKTEAAGIIFYFSAAHL